MTSRHLTGLAVIAAGILLSVMLGSGSRLAAQAPGQAVDEEGAPQFRVDPFWPKPLPNRWSMQQVTGIHVDHMDHIWFLNRNQVAEGDEIGGDGSPSRIDCCVRGPEVIELDQEGNVVNAWGGAGHHPRWPTALQNLCGLVRSQIWPS